MYVSWSIAREWEANEHLVELLKERYYAPDKERSAGGRTMGIIHGEEKHGPPLHIERASNG